MSESSSASSATLAPAEPVRIGVVSFLNTLPLIDGLDTLRDAELRHSVPSLLIDQLLGDEVDVALCSSIDYQRSPEPLTILPVGLLGCEGATLTVRLYSSTPLEKITAVHADTDSHTSIALMRILLKERHGLEPEVIAYHAREHVAQNKPIDWPETMLLIGDKVVTDSPPAVRYPHQLDLGAAWRETTGLPFVFAAWMAKRTANPALLRRAMMVLDRTRRANAMRIDSIAHTRAKSRNWPGDLAEKYLSELLAFNFTPERKAGLELFFEKAAEHGLIRAKRELAVFTGG